MPAGARALGLTREQIAAGLRDFANTADAMPGRMNLYVRGDQLMVIDYAHNEAGLDALLNTTEGLIGRRGKRRAKLTVVIGTAGDRPEDSLRAIGRMAGERADKVAVKETLSLLRGRSRAGMLGEMVAGARSAGVHGAVAEYPDEMSAIQAELPDAGANNEPYVLAIMCHEQRTEVRDYLIANGFAEVVDPRTLTDLRG
jgi:cyanophycin synthetase